MMKDETIHEAKPLKRTKLPDSIFDNLTGIIIVIALIILFALLFTYCKGNQAVVLGLAEILTMVEL
jgi:hypothetical protein